MTLHPLSTVIGTPTDMENLPSGSVIRMKHFGKATVCQLNGTWHPLIHPTNLAVNFDNQVVVVLHRPDEADVISSMIVDDPNALAVIPDGSVILVGNSRESSVRGVAYARENGTWLAAAKGFDFTPSSFEYRYGIINALWSPDTDGALS
ncbi:MAG: hypothetical protein E6R04_06900 [Spirochaetes bacterium]|nr:MAG: hypothetical protein E6R04_06900 [Spirochaetota bacterium]